MAIYGIQTSLKDMILSQYFGRTLIDTTDNELYVGLGLTPHGASVNLEDFTEVFEGRPLGNYRRARVIFGAAINAQSANVNEIAFPTATELWTTNNDNVEMIGIFNTLDYVDSNEDLIKPLVVLPLQTKIQIDRGQTLILRENSIILRLTEI